MINKIANKETLQDAWGRLTKNEDSHGVSGLSISKFKENLDSNLLEIHNLLKEKKYKFSPTRATFIRKKDGDPRPLQVPEIKDRIVLKSLAIYLEEVFKDVLKPNRKVSFAYQKESSVKDAIVATIKYYDGGNKIILETDVENFFGSISLDMLLKEKVFPRLSCDFTKELILDGLTQKFDISSKLPKEVKEIFKTIVPGAGVPQGNSLSPLLSNIYLSDLDQYAMSHGYNMVRYADDLLFLTTTKSKAEEIKNDISVFLERSLNLTLKAKKTFIINPEEKNLEFLSVRFDGKKLYPTDSAVRKFVSNTVGYVDECKAGKLGLFDFMQKLKLSQEGWIAVFAYTLIEPYEHLIDTAIDRALYIGFTSLKWNLVRKNLEPLPKDFIVRGGGSRLKISALQRKNSGILLTHTLIAEKRKKNPLLINDP